MVKFEKLSTHVAAAIVFCVFKAHGVGWAIQKGLHHVWG